MWALLGEGWSGDKLLALAETSPPCQHAQTPPAPPRHDTPTATQYATWTWHCWGSHREGTQHVCHRQWWASASHKRRAKLWSFRGCGASMFALLHPLRSPSLGVRGRGVLMGVSQVCGALMGCRPEKAFLGVMLDPSQGAGGAGHRWHRDRVLWCPGSPGIGPNTELEEENRG